VVVIKNIVLIVAITAPIYTWYIPHAKYIQEIYTFFGNPNGLAIAAWGTPKGMTPETLLYYPKVMVWMYGIGAIPTIVWIVSLLVLRKKWVPTIGYFMLSIFATLIIQAYIQDKTAKYIVYIYPLMVITSIYAIMVINNRIVRYGMHGILIASMVGNYLLAQIQFPDIYSYHPLARYIHIPVLPGVAHMFTYENWPVERIVSENFHSSMKQSSLLVLSDHQYLNHVVFQLHANIHALPIKTSQALLFYDPMDPKVRFEDLKNYDYIFTKTSGDLGVLIDKQTTLQINEHLSSEHPDWKVNEYTLPDGSTGIMYKTSL